MAVAAPEPPLQTTYQAMYIFMFIEKRPFAPLRPYTGPTSACRNYQAATGRSSKTHPWTVSRLPLANMSEDTNTQRPNISHQPHEILPACLRPSHERFSLALTSRGNFGQVLEIPRNHYNQPWLARSDTTTPRPTSSTSGTNTSGRATWTTGAVSAETWVCQLTCPARISVERFPTLDPRNPHISWD